MPVIAILVLLAVWVVGRLQKGKAERAAASLVKPIPPIPHEPTAEERARGETV